MAIKDPFDHGYEKTVNGVMTTLNSAADKAESNTAFMEQYRAVYLSLPDKLRSVAAALGVAYAQGKDDELKTLMETGIKALDLNSQHIISLSLHLNDPSILEAGYPFKPKPAAKPKVNLADLVPEVLLKYLYVNRMIVPEAAVASIKRAKTNAVVELQVTENPGDEASWRKFDEGMFNESRVEMRGLPSTKILYMRGRYHENGVAGHWSPVVSILIH